MQLDQQQSCRSLYYQNIAGYTLYVREVATTTRQQMETSECVYESSVRVAHLAFLASGVLQCLAVEKSALWTVTKLLHY